MLLRWKDGTSFITGKPCEDDERLRNNVGIQNTVITKETDGEAMEKADKYDWM